MTDPPPLPSRCLWVVNPRSEQTHLETVCGQPATSTIRIRDRIAKGEVPVCSKHKADYNRSNAASRKSSRKTQPSN